MKVVHMLINLGYPVLQLYWRMFKPKTYGVRILIHDEDNVLLIQQTYGDKNLLLIPGGGYKPKKETPLDAAKREVLEELGTAPENITELGTYTTTAEGKLDTVALFSGTVTPAAIHIQKLEIAKIQWAPYTQALKKPNLSTVAQKAIREHYKY